MAVVLMKAQHSTTVKLQKLNHYVQSLCGIYSRIARRLGVDRTYVSRVARGERRSPEVEAALIQDFERSVETPSKPH
jgi:hypothetical protein